MRKKLTKELLMELTLEGKTHREIAKITGYSKSNVGYWMKKFNLTELNKNKPKIDYKDKNYFKKIDTKEKAYILGFLLADGYISDKQFSLTLAKRDVSILEFIQKELGGNIGISDITNKAQKKYPYARIGFHDNTLVKDLKMLTGGTLKKERRIPIISPKLEKYLLLGFFDGDGAITWGRRKDRDRIWQKVSFTSQFRMLEGIQNILYKQVNIPTKIRPKSDGSDCYVLSFASKKAVVDFLEYIHDDLIVLERKYQNGVNLRLELEEFGKS